MISLSRIRAVSKAGDVLLDDRQQKRLRQLSVIEKVLFRKLFDHFENELVGSGGVITSSQGFVSIGKAVDRIFDIVEAEHLNEFVKATAADMKDVVDVNAQHYKPMARGRDYRKVKADVNARMRQRLGIDEEDGVIRNGYLDGLMANKPLRERVKKMVAKAIAGQMPKAQLRAQLQNRITGTPGSAGLLEGSLGPLITDAYNIADSVTNNVFAEKLGLKFFVYSGGLIENSRAFCRTKNNKVFTTDEAEKDWPQDPTLPRTKAEAEADGPPADYVPLEDRGRWNCRHRLLYIPKEQAYALRPDLNPNGPKPKLPEAPPLSQAPGQRSDPTGLPLVQPGSENGLGSANQEGSAAFTVREQHRAARKSDNYDLVRPRGIDTAEQYTKKDGTWSAQRKKLHDEIIADATAGVPKQEKPTLFMMGGGPAAGKSTLIKSGVVKHPETHVLMNPDVFKEDLPEYKEMLAAGDTQAAAIVHEESSYLNKQTAKQARANKQDVVWDGTGDGTLAKLRDQITAFRDAGYRVVADYVTLPTEEAVKRVFSRGKKTGRFVPLTDVRNTHRAVSQVFLPAVQEGLFDQVTLWDSSTPDLIKVASARGKSLTIHNKRLWDVFLAKGGEAFNL